MSQQRNDDPALEAGIGQRLKDALGTMVGLGRNAARAGEGDGRQDGGRSDIATIVDALPLPAMIVDGRQLIVYGNLLARELFTDLRPDIHVLRATRDPQLATALGTTLASGATSKFELYVRTPVERRLEGSVTRLAGDGTSGGAAIVVLQDQSERDALSRMRMEFVANASHELRTPLAALSGFIETLSGPARDDPAARERFLAIMAEQAQRMTRLIDDLLLLSRVEMRLHLAPTTLADLDLVSADAIRHVAMLAAAEGARVVHEPLGGAASARVRGDHDELVQAVQNLVHNALKYGRPGGNVIVRVTRGSGRRGRDVRVAVIDDGPGIPPEHVPRLTERFYRVSTTASREKGGTGLGLSIVKNIVTRHQGAIDISSELGKGATFTIAIPAAE